MMSDVGGCGSGKGEKEESGKLSSFSVNKHMNYQKKEESIKLSSSFR